MRSETVRSTTQWIWVIGALAAILLVYHIWVHVNPTTVALTLLLYILLLAARLQLRHAVVVSLVATACWNFYFLPPIGTFTIADPQNWLALFAFLSTSVVGSSLSQQAREEATRAREREREIEVLFQLGRELLQTDRVAELVNTLPAMIGRVTGSSSVRLFLLDGERVYQTGRQPLAGTEAPHLRQLALGLPDVEITGELVHIPVREGVRPRGLLTIAEVALSEKSYRTIGDLTAVALDRAQALEDVARAEANRESERLRTLILDSITHELRTPLTAIKGAASSLLNTTGIVLEDRQELLEIVDEEADRLNRLIGQAVEMAQLEGQEIHMKFRAVDLAELVEAARGTCATVFTSHPIHVSLTESLRVFADPEMIVKVLCNLLENAAKYSQPGSPIFISGERRGEMILTSVADRGVGIDPTEQPFIFDRLYRVRAASQDTPGTGMGLAICRAIIDAHSGHLSVTSQPGHGSVFTFSLPVAVTKQ